MIFSSDHGELLGNHQQLLKGPQLYDDLCRVPLIAHGPDQISAGQRITNPVQWIDLSATMLVASGCGTGTGVQGQTLLPMMQGEDVDCRSWALCEYRYSGFPTDPLIMTTMLRHEDWKLIVWHGRPACGNSRDGELYNLSDDPGELHNLFHATDHSDQRRMMKKLMLDAMADAEDRTQKQSKPW